MYDTLCRAALQIFTLDIRLSYATFTIKRGPAEEQRKSSFLLIGKLL